MTTKEVLNVYETSIENIFQICIQCQRLFEQNEAQSEHDREELKNKIIAFTKSAEERTEMSYYIREGSVTQRKDGRYIARIYIFGKQRQVAIGPIKKNVVDKLNDIVRLKFERKIKSLEELNLYLDNPFSINTESKEPTKPQLTLIAWIETWLETYKRPKVCNNYYIQLRSNIKKHIKPNFADLPLKDYPAIELQRGLNKIKSSRMKENAYILINGALKTALALEYISKNFMETIEFQKHERTPGIAFTIEEQNIFLAAAQDMPLAELFLFQLYSGARPGEARRMKWSFIDFEKETVYIDGTKNKYAKRVIPLFQKLKDILQNIPRTEDRIFPFSQDQATTAFNDIRDKARLNPDFEQYNLRHTFSTRANEAGIDLKTIALWMGHNNTETTEKIYIQSQSEHQKAMRKKFDDFI